MPVPAKTFLLADPDTQGRTLLAWHLSALGAQILQAADGRSAMDIARARPIAILVTELYLPTGSDDCLITAARRDPAFKRTKIVAHTNRAQTADREWAMRAGADAYLIKPTRAQRVRYVVSRLMGDTRSVPQATPAASITRRSSLEEAMQEIERGELADTSTIVFGRVWWNTLSSQERQAFRTRARKAHVNLRSDSILGNHFVEVRGATRDGIGLSTEQPESPYRR